MRALILNDRLMKLLDDEASAEKPALLGQAEA
jgi:hypothetical protein